MPGIALPGYVGGQLVWVDITFPDGRSRRLQGMDRYWLAWPDYGSYNVDVEQYTGRQAVSYRWCLGIEIDTGCLRPPQDAEVWIGEMVPNEVAREVGIL